MVPRYFIVNKPYDMLSQFKSEKNGDLLGSLEFDFPEGIHAVGRLDKQSEGLLILTTNKKITRLLFQGDILHKRTYLVKVKNNVSEESLQRLRTGITIRVKGGENYITAGCEANIVQKPSNLFQQVNPLPEFAPHTWLLITLTEGKFHQIRKMVRMIHHRCQRLIRISIEDLALENLAPGHVKEIEEAVFFRLLKIENPYLSVATDRL
jgi:23S rRNA pseudouridine2457 synthase